MTTTTSTNKTVQASLLRPHSGVPPLRPPRPQLRGEITAVSLLERNVRAGHEQRLLLGRPRRLPGPEGLPAAPAEEHAVAAPRAWSTRQNRHSLLHPTLFAAPNPLLLVGVSIGMERGRQKNASLSSMAPRAGRRLALLGRQPEHDPLGDPLSAGRVLRGRRPGLGPGLLDRNPLRPGWCEGKAVSQRSLGGGDAGQRHCRGHEGSGNTKQRHVLTRKAVETRSKGTASARIRRSGTALPLARTAVQTTAR